MRAQQTTPDSFVAPEPEYARLTLEGMATLGDCYAPFEEQTINVFGGLPGEQVVARIVRFRRRRRKFVSAIVERVLLPSPHRVAPPCPLFGPCSGCQWQHVSYEHQLTLKREAVAREIGRYPELDGVTVARTVPSPQPFNYRNHARFTVRRSGSLGFTNRITRRFVRVDECMLMTPGINGALAELQDNCSETTQLSVRYGVNTGDFLVQPTLQHPAIGIPSGQSITSKNCLASGSGSPPRPSSRSTPTRRSTWPAWCATGSSLLAPTRFWTPTRESARSRCCSRARRAG